MKFRWLFLLFIAWLPTRAQEYSDPFTTPNPITIRLQGTTAAYDYNSGQLLIRLEQRQNQLQFSLPLSSLVPANDKSPLLLPYQLFNAEDFPVLRFWFEAPANLTEVNDRQLHTITLQGAMEVQGKQNPMEAQLTFMPGRDDFTVSTTFAFNAYGMGAVVTPAIAPYLTGVVELAIPQARWQRHSTQR